MPVSPRTMQQYPTKTGLLARKIPLMASYSRKMISSSGSSHERSTGNNCGPLVTTSHLFWPSQRGKAAWLLPIWLRNSGFPAGNGDRGRGGSAARSRQDASIHKVARNFVHKWLPCPVPAKKWRLTTTATTTPTPAGKDAT